LTRKRRGFRQDQRRTHVRLRIFLSWLLFDEEICDVEQGLACLVEVAICIMIASAALPTQGRPKGYLDFVALSTLFLSFFRFQYF
jgi:hypothetical protein